MEHVVLGLHGLSHESGACVLTPEGAWALSEERLSRRKYDGGLPALSAPWALRAAGLAGWSDVDLVVVDLLGGSHERLSAWVREQGYEGPLATCSHHDAHAASAWFPSPFDEAAVLVVDAGGSKVREIGDAAGTPPAGIPSHRWPHFCEVQTAYLADRDGLAPLRRSYAGPPWGVNPGVLYGMSALFLGFGPMGAGKLMGLAPFGHPPAHLPPAFFSDTEHGPLAHCEDWPLRKELLNGHYRDLYGVAPRAEDGPLEGVHEDIASWVQEQASAAVLSHVRRIVAETGRRRLCLAGGFGLNAVTNRRILEETPVEELYVQPAATDAGAPLGCALWGAHVVLGAPRSPLRPPVALGGDYAAEVEAALRSRGGLRVHHCADIASETARAIADGAIVGWFQGRSEYGPRALGHRSLLADPRSERSVECLNRQIKLRESFRPYAPRRPGGVRPDLLRPAGGAEPLHAPHLPGARVVARPTAGDHARGRQRPGADRLGRRRATLRRAPRGLRRDLRRPRPPQHELQPSGGAHRRAPRRRPRHARAKRAGRAGARGLVGREGDAWGEQPGLRSGPRSQRSRCADERRGQGRKPAHEISHRRRRLARAPDRRDRFRRGPLER